MPAPDPLLFILPNLNRLQIPYAVSGGVAAIYYGEPRFTNDVDIVLYLQAGDVPRLAAAFPPDQYYCPPEEVIRLELGRARRGHFNLIHRRSGFKADIYLSGSDPLHEWALPRIRKTEIEGETLALAPPEYVIVRKLQYYREGGSTKHLRDIQRMLVAMGPDWDRSETEGLVLRHGLQPAPSPGASSTTSAATPRNSPGPAATDADNTACMAPTSSRRPPRPDAASSWSAPISATSPSSAPCSATCGFRAASSSSASTTNGPFAGSRSRWSAGTAWKAS